MASSTRSRLEQDLFDLRRAGIAHADPDRLPALTEALRTCDYLHDATGLATAVGTCVRAIVREYPDNPSSRLLFEALTLHPTTAGLSPSDAFAVSVGRITSRPATDIARERVSKNQWSKAVAFMARLLEERQIYAGMPSESPVEPENRYRSGRPARWHVRYHPLDYIGPIWLRIDPIQTGTHAVVIIWGDYLFEGQFFIGDSGLALIHHKLETDQLPLYVHVTPSSRISVGTGQPRGVEEVDIDEGWVRIEGAPVHR